MRSLSSLLVALDRYTLEQQRPVTLPLLRQILHSPPFHTPVFVMTHHLRPSFTLSDTTFHFVDAAPAEVLELAREAAQGKDIRIGGGAMTVREFLDAGLIDTLHVAVSPDVTLGEGSRLWESPDELLDRYHCDVVPSSSGVIHHLFWRR